MVTIIDLPQQKASVRLLLFLLFSVLCLLSSASVAPGGDAQKTDREDVPGRRLKVLMLAPMLAWSHMQFMGKIADTLAEAGHQVHYLKMTYDPVLADKNETRLSQRVYRLVLRMHTSDTFDLNKVAGIGNPFSGDGFPLLSVFDDKWESIAPMWRAMCEEMASNTELLEELTREQYDVGMSELYDLCAFAVMERIKVHTKLAALAVPPVQMSISKFGIPTFSSFVPNMMATPLNSPHFTFLDRVVNFYNDLYDWKRTHPRMDEIQEPVIKRYFGEDFMSLGKIGKSISLLFVNSNPFLEFARPISSKIVHIGGLVNAKAGKLDERTQSVLDNSAKGAVLVSFGSITDTTKMSVGMRRAFLRAFGCFPEYTFLWKLDGSHRDNDSALFAAAPNVHLFDWVQQTAILRHPRVRGFVSHCGQNSLSEAANAGVPLVAVPLFGDQLYNAVLAKHKGMAVYLDVRQLQTEGAEQLMVDSLEKILHVPSFRANAQLLSKKLRLTPFSPRDRLVRWVQFAAQFPHLEELNLPTDHDLHWLAYYSVDVLLFSAAAILLVGTLSFVVLVKLFRLLSTFAPQKQKKL